VSPLDVMISYLGIDVATFGLQVFTAAGLLARRAEPNPAVPLFVLELAGLGIGADGAALDRYRSLVRHLGRAYPGGHSVTLVNLTAVPGRRSHASVPLSQFGKLLPHVAVNSHLFIDAAKPHPRKES
jgi:hypothetical protein